MEESEYIIKLDIQINHITAPDNLREKIYRENMQTHINRLAFEFINDPLNQQNLMNRILKNDGIIIGDDGF